MNGWTPSSTDPVSLSTQSDYDLKINILFETLNHKHYKPYKTEYKMSVKHSCTTADYLEWDVAMNLVHRLYRDGEIRMSLLIGCGCFFGLRISDLLRLTWSQVLSDEGTFTLREKKTGKRRMVKVNSDFKKHIKDCHDALGVKDDEQNCFRSQKGTVYSIQRVNVKLKDIKTKYGIRIEHFSTHTLRKTFGRKVFESAGEQAEMALVRLMELFNHSSVSITKRYLGIRQKELLETYDLLDF